MRHLAMWIGISALAAGGACTRDDQSMSEKLDKLDQRMARMESQLARLAAASPGARRARAERPRPNPSTTYAVPLNGAPITGNPEAPVTIVEGFEFACGWCEKSRSLVKEVLDEYGDDVRLVHKTFLVHPDTARVPALAGCAANEQGKFAALEPLIWDKGFKARKLDADHMVALAAEAGLDVDRFKKDMTSPECAQKIATDHRQLAQVGVSGTPAFYINGRWLPRRSKADFKRLIDEELAKAKERIADGTRAEAYYAEWVEKRGAKKL
jgi:protein-disulfide isomerase